MTLTYSFKISKLCGGGEGGTIFTQKKTLQNSTLYLLSKVLYISTGAPKTINFPFVPNGILMDVRCPNI